MRVFQASVLLACIGGLPTLQLASSIRAVVGMPDSPTDADSTRCLQLMVRYSLNRAVSKHSSNSRHRTTRRPKLVTVIAAAATESTLTCSYSDSRLQANLLLMMRRLEPTRNLSSVPVAMLDFELRLLRGSRH